MAGKIMPNRLDRVFYQYQQELEAKALEVLRSGRYVLGPEVESFEREFANYPGTAWAWPAAWTPCGWLSGSWASAAATR